MRDVSALQSPAAFWALTGCGCFGCTNPPWRHGTKRVCKGFLWPRKRGVMGSSICKDEAAQANTLCSSLGRERPGMHQKELEGKFIHCAGEKHNTKQPQAVSSSPRTLGPNEPPLLTETGGWLEYLEPQSPTLHQGCTVQFGCTRSGKFLFLSMEKEKGRCCVLSASNNPEFCAFWGWNIQE